MTTRSIVALCIVLALLGWVGLGSFTYHNPPDAWNRWIALAILWPTLLATFFPLAHAIHLRLGRSDDMMLRAARQSALAALYLTLCVWLRFIRAFNWANAILILVLFVVTDVLLSARENE
jgi:hypothetical protein